MNKNYYFHVKKDKSNLLMGLKPPTKKIVMMIVLLLPIFSIFGCQEKGVETVGEKITSDYPAVCKVLQHKLTLSGNITNLKINANQVISKACRDNLGAAHFRTSWADDSRSFYNTANDVYLFDQECETALKNLKLPLTRIYNLDAEASGLHKTLDHVANICNRLGTSQGKIILCIEPYVAKQITPVSVYQDAVNYIKSKGYGFKYWEISNEPQYAWGSGLDNPVIYAKHVKEVYTAIKAIDPMMRVGCQICRKSWYTDQVLANLEGKADFISGHWYGITNTDKYSTSDVILAENFKNLNYIAYENQNILSKTGKEIPQIDTEWRLFAEGTVNGVHQTGEWNDRNANIVGTIYQAVRLIYCIRDNYTFGACTWHTQGAQPGVLVPSGWLNTTNLNGKTSYLYWLYYYMINHTGEKVLDFTGTAPSYTGIAIHNIDFGGADESYTGPLTPAMVTTSTDGRKIYITVVNGSSTQTIPFTAQIDNFKINSKSAVCISDQDLNQSFYQTSNARFISTPQLNGTQTELSCSLPPLSCTFITLTK